MAAATDRLMQVAANLREGQIAEPITPRTLLRWFEVEKRTYWNVDMIREVLGRCGLETLPDFNDVYLDANITLVLRDADSAALEGEVATEKTLASIGAAANSVAPDESPFVAGARITDPTYRLRRLKSAGTQPLSVSHNATLQEVVTQMLAHDFSQIPVMHGQREVKGVVTWASIGRRLALGVECNTVRDCMESPNIISDDVPISAAIESIVQHEYALIRAPDNIICGIVTTSDLGLQLNQLGQPFFILGEIENHIRKMIEDRFTHNEIVSMHDPADGLRNVDSVHDLTFGDYLHFLNAQEHWAKLNLKLDRAIFTTTLDKIRQIRNDVMHFDPDGIPDDDLQALRDFLQLMQSLRQIKAI